jgi:uncharacterized SAM-binding protein YcdF (DUF218 family)
MDLIKQLVGELAKPLVIAVLIGAVAGIYRLLGRWRLAAWLSASAALIAYLSALVPVGNALLGPLERQYPALRTDQPLPVVQNIVVLGSGYTPRGDIPVTGALDESGLVRIVEGVRLARRMGAARLVVSGGAPPGRTPSAIGYARLARDLGVADASLVVSSSAIDTSAEARRGGVARSIALHSCDLCISYAACNAIDATSRSAPDTGADRPIGG